MATQTPPSSGASAAATPPEGPATAVAALLVAERLDDDLIEVLLAVADQTHPPDLLRVIDATASGELATSLESNTGLREHLPTTEIDRVTPGTDIREAVAAAVSDLDAEIVWVLTGVTRPEPDALHQLSTALAATADAAMAGPKLLDADRPGRLQRFGIQATRSGRLRPAPAPGQPDQQQFDDQRDAVAVPIEGALIRRDAFLGLGGFDPAFTGPAADLDLGWRAHRAGWSVGLAPAARVHLRGRPAHPVPTRDRREARRVALTRSPLALAPVLAIWIALSQLASAAGLLLLKRPRAAGREVADIGALAAPWRLLAARRRARATTRRGKRHRVPFVPGRTVLAGGLDRLPEFLVPSARPPVRPGSDDLAAGADPNTQAVIAEPEEHEQAVRNPGPWAVLIAAVAAVVAGRTLPSGLTGGLRDGFAGGQLTGISSTAAGLWHGWRDRWRGPGLGTDAPGSTAQAPLAAATWLWQHLPLHDSGPNPAGGLIGLALLLGAPAAATSAYLAGRVLTRRRWPRAVAALVWALSPVSAATIGEGRIGGLALLVLLPPVLAGFAALAGSRRSGVSAAAALPTALLAAFVPGTLVLAAVLAIGMALGGGARTKRRAAAYLFCTALASAPVLWELRTDPLRILGGWGLLATSDAAITPLQLSLLSPELPTTLWPYAVLPVLGLGALGLLRRPSPTGPAWFAGAVIVLGVALAVAAPRVLISRGAGESIVTPWSGTGMLLALAGVLAAGLHGSDRISGTARRIVGVTAALAAAIVVVGFAAGGLGDQLRPARDPRPAVAADQAGGPAAGRSVVVDISRGSVSYALIGREPAAPAPELADGPLADPGIESAIGALTAASGATASSSVQELARWGVGFVVVRPPVPVDVEHRLDATEFLSRIGDYDQGLVWRIEPAAAGPGLTAPARARLVTSTTGGGAPGDRLVPVTGQHGATRTHLELPAAARLEIAEPAAWANSARVVLDGTRLEGAIVDGRPSYVLPAGEHDLRIAVANRFPAPVGAYLVLLAVLAYLAIPLGSRPNQPAGSRPDKAAGATS